MSEDRLLSVLNVSKLVEEMKTMIPDLTTISENNEESAQKDKKSQQNEQFVMDLVMHFLLN